MLFKKKIHKLNIIVADNFNYIKKVFILPIKLVAI